jgi:hypothetical protein
MMDLKFVRTTLLLVIVIASAQVLRAQSPEPKKPGLPAGAVPARPVADPAVKLGWQRYEIGSMPTFGVVLPSPPGVTFESVQGQQVNTYVSTNASGVYAAARIDRLPLNLETAPEDARSKYFQSFFNGFARGFQKGLGPTVKDSLALLEVTQLMTATGRKGFQQRLTLGSMQGRSQMVFVGDSAFALVALWLPDAPASDYDSFFDSFRLK